MRKYTIFLVLSIFIVGCTPHLIKESIGDSYKTSISVNEVVKSYRFGSNEIHICINGNKHNIQNKNNSIVNKNNELFSVKINLDKHTKSNTKNTYILNTTEAEFYAGCPDVFSGYDIKEYTNINKESGELLFNVEYNNEKIFFVMKPYEKIYENRGCKQCLLALPITLFVDVVILPLVVVGEVVQMPITNR